VVLRILVICSLVVPVAIERSIGAEPNRKEANERIQRAIAFLDSGAWDFQKATEALDTVTKLAPSDRKAQIAALGYLDRVGRTIQLPPFYARLLSRFDPGFAGELTASLPKTQKESTKLLWLQTIATMGPRASQQAEALRKYIESEPDPTTRLVAHAVYAVVKRPPGDYSKTFERDIHDRTPAGLATVYFGTVFDIRTWASEKSIADVRRWLVDDVPQDCRCLAAVVLAVSGSRDESVTRDIRGLLEKAMQQEPDGSSDIVYAYALALQDPRQTERSWRIILKKLGGNLNHTDWAALLLICNSIPSSHIATIGRLRSDPDHEVAAGVEKIERSLGAFFGGIDRSSARVAPVLPQ
jgi:hypothetical protein